MWLTKIRRWALLLFVSVIPMVLALPTTAISQEMSKEDIVKELRGLKERIIALETELGKKDQEIEKIKEQTKHQKKAVSVIEKKMKPQSDFLASLQDRIHFSGLLEFGGVWDNVKKKDGGKQSNSDLNLTTAELSVEAQVHEWVGAAATFLYQDPTFTSALEESGLSLDVAIATIGNPDKFPLYLTVGALYVPFGALYTHFPDDPLIDEPLTLALGETREKAPVLVFEYEGFALSGYLFNGDMNKTGSKDKIESFGFDANYGLTNDKGFDFQIGASYISNIADSEGLTEALHNAGVDSIQNYVGGFDGYLSVSYSNFFLDLEYMTALRKFAPDEISTWNGGGAKPLVWNAEGGYNYNWGKNLEIVLKYAGSNDTENLGWPKHRYGLGLNQEVFVGVTVSLAYFHDIYHNHDADEKDSRDVVFGQIAVEF